jgi:hypothetical protein
MTCVPNSSRHDALRSVRSSRRACLDQCYGFAFQHRRILVSSRGSGPSKHPEQTIPSIVFTAPLIGTAIKLSLFAFAHGSQGSCNQDRNLIRARSQFLPIAATLDHHGGRGIGTRSAPSAFTSDKDLSACRESCPTFVPFDAHNCHARFDETSQSLSQPWPPDFDVNLGADQRADWTQNKYPFETHIAYRAGARIPFLISPAPAIARRHSHPVADGISSL